MGPQIRLYKLWVSATVPRVLRRLRAALLVLFGLFVLYLVLYIGYTAWRLRQVDQGWASSFESMQAFAASFPKTATSPGARSLISRHELISQLAVESIAGAENGILRVLAVPSVRWADRVQAQDLPAALLRAFQAEAFLYTHSQSVKDFRGASAFNQLNMAAYSEQVRLTTELLRDRDDSCSLDLQAVSRAAEDALPRSNGARTSIASVFRSWGAVTGIRLDGELTRLVMEARRDSGERPRAPLPVASTVCKSVTWIPPISNSVPRLRLHVAIRGPEGA